MIQPELIEQINEYIAAYEEYNEELKQIKFSVGRGFNVDQIGKQPEEIGRAEKIIRTLKDKVGMAGTYFSDYLFKLIKEKNLSEVEVYKKANLDRRIFSKIRNEKNYMPSKKTVLAMAISMELDLQETNNLLSRAGYYLSCGRREDIIVSYFIKNQIYDLFLINEVLDYYECPILGG